ncbi:MAG: XamI family restriction endonuclease [Chloroflexales bacterium]
MNADKPHLWKQDVAQSVDFYNQWFMQFAPLTYRETRVTATQRVKTALQKTSYFNTPVYLSSNKAVNIPIDAVVMPMYAPADALPLLIEAKSAGDFTNTNKRRKEEAVKMAQLQKTYGDDVRFILFLCGYFDSGYLGYEAAEGIDWVWEHRIDDLVQFGL